MKKGSYTFFMAVFIGMIFLAVGVLTAVESPVDVKIENQGYKKDKKGSVHLSHKKHSEEYKIACTECHHDYKDGKNMWKEGDPVKKCTECHNPEKKEGNVDKLMSAFHKNCKDCHKDVAKQGKEKAPHKKCNDCHAKK